MLIIGLILTYYVVTNTLASLKNEMKDVSDMTLFQALVKFNFGEVKKIISGTIAALKRVGAKAFGPLIGLFIVFFYMILKMFLCSCACNNCP